MGYQWRKPIWAWFVLAFFFAIVPPLLPFKNEALMTVIAAPAAVLGCVGAMIAAFRTPQGNVTRKGIVLRFIAAGFVLALLTPIVLFQALIAVDAFQTGDLNPTMENATEWLGGSVVFMVFGSAFGLAIGVPWLLFAGVVFAFVSLTKTDDQNRTNMDA